MKHLLEEAFGRLENKLHEAPPDMLWGGGREKPKKLSELHKSHLKSEALHTVEAGRAERAGNPALAKKHKEAAAAHREAHSLIGNILSKKVKADGTHSTYNDGGYVGVWSHEDEARDKSDSANKSSSDLKESHLQEFAGFGSSANSKAADDHEKKADEFYNLHKHHKENGDTQHANAYWNAYAAHRDAARAHKEVVDGANSSKINRASSSSRKSAEEASRNANSIQTPKPTQGAKHRAILQNVHTIDHHDSGGVSDSDYNHLMVDKKPPTEDHERKFLGPYWHQGESK